MANTASAKRRIRRNARRAMYNRLHRSRARTAVKKVRQAILAKDLTTAQALIKQAISYLDRAAGKGVIHKNNAARRKSRLMKMLNKALATQKVRAGSSA